jgi:hypothetical protein
MMMMTKMKKIQQRQVAKCLVWVLDQDHQTLQHRRQSQLPLAPLQLLREFAAQLPLQLQSGESKKPCA